MNPLRELGPLGQSVWLDFISRSVLRSGELQRLVDEDGVSGVTSNPTIFQKAMAAGTDYDDQLRGLLAATPQIDTGGAVRGGGARRHPGAPPPCCGRCSTARRARTGS